MFSLRFTAPACAALALALPTLAGAQTAVSSTAVLPPVALPAGTVVHVSLLKPMGSATATTGESFAFVTTDDVVVGNAVVLPKGSNGTGTVKLAGRAGGHGHEGDLVLDFTSVAGPDGSARGILAELEATGVDHKNAAKWGLFSSGILTGFGAAIQGADVSLAPTQVFTLKAGMTTKDLYAPKDAPTPAPSPAP
jgi:hypothetical protein